MSLIHKRIENKMLKKWMSLFLLLPMLSSFIYAGAQVQEDKKIAWIKNQTKIDAAVLNGKPGMLYFYAGLATVSSIGAKEEVESEKDRDIPRIGLSQETLNNRDLVALSRKFTCFEFNLDNSQQISAQYNVTAYPAVIFTDPWGNEVSLSLGNVSAEVLISAMEIFPEDYSDVFRWKKVLEENDRDYEALSGLGRFYLNLEVWWKSIEFYNRALGTKFVKENEEAREKIIFVIGLNQLRMRNYSEAQKLFEDYLDTVSDGKEKDKALLGLILAQLGQDKISGAQRNLKRLKSQFPDSPAVEQAARYIQSVKNSKK